MSIEHFEKVIQKIDSKQQIYFRTIQKKALRIITYIYTQKQTDSIWRNPKTIRKIADSKEPITPFQSLEITRQSNRNKGIR